MTDPTQGDAVALIERLRAPRWAAPISAQEVCLEAAALLAQQAETIERLTKPTCSCMEVYGEDPNCFKHGRGTAWRKANPDISNLYDQLDAAEARVAQAVALITDIQRGVLSRTAEPVRAFLQSMEGTGG